MSAGVWSRLRDWAAGLWDRHVRFREVYRQLGRMRAAVGARTAWIDELSDEELAELLTGLRQCLGAIEAVEAAGSDAPGRADGTA